MTIEHTVLTSSQVHEPKHITNSSTADSGKVITPSDSAAGTSVLRRLTVSDLEDERSRITTRIEDISEQGNVYLVAPFNGVITRVQLVLNGAITGNDATVTVHVGATQVASLNVQGGSSAGDTFAVSVSSNNTVSDNQAVRINTDGGSTGSVSANVVLTFVGD